MTVKPWGKKPPVHYTTATDFIRHPKTGHIVPESLINVRLALQRLFVALSYDDFAAHLLIGTTPADDAAIEALWATIDDTFHFRPALTFLHTVARVEGRRRTFHPVRDYLSTLRWDGVPRLDTWLVDYAGATGSPYVAAVSALPLIAAVRRVRDPGCKFDELLVLESAEQGLGKSEALRALCPRSDWFSDDLPLAVDAKQIIERTSGRWLIEASELYGNRGREVEQVKAFLSRQTDGPVRLAFERIPVAVRRQFILVGTTNSRAGYLKDPTGARRFWPVAVTRFDVDGIHATRDQLWAEAAKREQDGESIRLPRSLWADAGLEQEARRAVDPWEDTLHDLLTDTDEMGEPVKGVSVETIWTTVGVDVDAQDNRNAGRIAEIVQRYGFTRKTRLRLIPGGKPVRCWVRDGAEDGQ